jgi:iron-sulfur cluster assembly accessory protein
VIQVTQEALDQFKTLAEQQDDKSLVLRLYAREEGGQMRFGMAWSEAEESDVVLESDGVCLHLEEVSVPFLAGVQIGYVEEELRRGFSIRVPGMGGCACGGGSCGCGANH